MSFSILSGEDSFVNLIDTGDAPVVLVVSESITGGGGGVGTVTSVALTAPNIFSVAGSPVTTAGTLAITLATQSANTVFAGPASGADAAPSFRALVEDDIPALPYVISVGLQMPGQEFTVFNSPVTSSGTLAVAWLNQDYGYFLGGPTGGGTPHFRPLVPDMYSTAVGNSSNDPQTGWILSCQDVGANIFEWIAPGGGGGGSVTNVSVVTANGVSGAVANPTTTPAITLTLGAITPSSVAAVGAVTGSNLSGTNTGDQTISLTGDVTGSGTGSFATTIANDAVTYAKMQDVSAADRLLGRGNGVAGDVQELSIGAGLTLTGTTLSATGSGGTVTTVSVVTANGVSGSVATPTTTPAITLTLGDITPTSIVASGTIAGSNLSGTNTGDQTITLTGDVTGSGTGSFAATIANDAVTYAKMQNVSAASRLIGRGDSGSGDPEEITIGSGLTMTGTTLSASGGMSIGGTVTSGTTGSVLFVGAGPVLSQDNAEFFWDDTNNRLGIGTATPSTPTHVLLTNATTNNATDVVLTLGHNSSGTAAAGFGARIDLQAETSTTTNQTVGSIQWAWSTATHASRVGQVKVYAATSGGNFEVALFSAASIQFAQLSSGLLTSASGTLTANTIAAGRIPFGTSGTAISTNNGLYWDNSNERLGVGNAINDNPQNPLHVATSTGGAVIVNVEYQPGGAGAVNDLAMLRFGLKSSTTTNQDAGVIAGVWSTATHASRTSFMIFQTAYNGGSNATRIGLRYTEATATTTSFSAEVTNSGLSLCPNGTGAFMLRIPDGSSGGNARGSNAIDLQTDTTAATQVASGIGAVVIGRRNTASIDDAVAIGKGNSVGVGNGIGIGLSNSVTTGAGNIAIGDNNTSSSAVASVVIGSTSTASGAYSQATGFEAVASIYGQNARANGKITTAGDAQRSELVWRCQTTDATPEEMFLDGASIRSTIGSNRLWTFKILVSALRDDASEGAGYEFAGVIRNDAGATTLVGAVTKAVWEDDATWDADVTADNTNDALIITVTGAAAKNINWVASGWLTEVAV